MKRFSVCIFLSVLALQDAIAYPASGYRRAECASLMSRDGSYLYVDDFSSDRALSLEACPDHSFCAFAESDANSRMLRIYMNIAEMGMGMVSVIPVDQSLVYPRLGERFEYISRSPMGDETAICCGDGIEEARAIGEEADSQPISARRSFGGGGAHSRYDWLVTSVPLSGGLSPPREIHAFDTMKGTLDIETDPDGPRAWALDASGGYGARALLVPGGHAVEIRDETGAWMSVGRFPGRLDGLQLMGQEGAEPGTEWLTVVYREDRERFGIKVYDPAEDRLTSIAAPEDGVRYWGMDRHSGRLLWMETEDAILAPPAEVYGAEPGLVEALRAAFEAGYRDFTLVDFAANGAALVMATQPQSEAGENFLLLPGAAAFVDTCAFARERAAALE